MNGDTDIWQRLSADPRVAENQSLRTSHADREVVLDELGHAYGLGQLDQAEFDERSSAVQAARTLGELLPLLDDLRSDAQLVPVSTPAAPAPAPEAADLRRRAVLHYEAQRKQALFALALGSNLICWAVYVWSMVATSSFIFPWPIFVSLGTLGRVAWIYSNKETIIEEKYQELLRSERPALPGQ